MNTHMLTTVEVAEMEKRLFDTNSVSNFNLVDIANLLFTIRKWENISQQQSEQHDRLINQIKLLKRAYTDRCAADLTDEIVQLDRKNDTLDS